jgi:hypothetical protein
MTTWTNTYHKFQSREDFLAACDLSGFHRDDDGHLILPDTVSFDIVGTLYRENTGPVDDGGFPLNPPEKIVGFHVNAAWAMDIPDPFKDAQISVSKPQRVWA